MASLLQEMSFCSFAPKGPTRGYQTTRLSKASRTQPAAGVTLPKQFPPTFLILIMQHVPGHSTRRTIHTERGEAISNCPRAEIHHRNSYEVGQVNKSTGANAVNTTRDHHGSGWEINILTPAQLTPSTHLSKREGIFTFIALGILHHSHHQTTPCTTLVTPGPARARGVRDTEMPQQLFSPLVAKTICPTTWSSTAF